MAIDPSWGGIDRIVPLARSRAPGPIVDGRRSYAGEWLGEAAATHNRAGLVVVTKSSNGHKSDDAAPP